MQGGVGSLSFPLGGNLATAIVSSLGAPPVPGRTYTVAQPSQKKLKKQRKQAARDALARLAQFQAQPPPVAPPAPVQAATAAPQSGSAQLVYGPAREQWTQPPTGFGRPLQPGPWSVFRPPYNIPELPSGPIVAGPTMPFAGSSLDQVALTSPWASEIRCPRYCAQPHHHHHHHDHHGGCE